MPHSASVRVRPRRDGSTAYDVRYREDGASKSQAFDTHSAAEKWAGIVRAVGPVEARAFLNLTIADGTLTVSEYAAKYIATKSGIEPKTGEHYTMYMRLHITPTLGHLPIDAVNANAIAAWVNMKAAEGYAGKTIKNWHGFLSAMFQSAVDADPQIIPRNPCAHTRLPETESVEMVFLSADEFTTLLSYIPEKSQPLVLLLAATGLRWGEATALRPTDFDLDAGTVRVSRAWKSSQAKGWYIGPPKTRRSKRTVSLPDNLITILRPLVETGTEYVFTNAFGKPVRQQNFHEAVWSPARRLANGLPAFDKSKVNPDREWTARTGGIWANRQPATKPLGKFPRIHDLRHSHVSWLLGRGVGIDVIARRLGHENITTTVDRYGHIAVERAARAGDEIGDVLAGSMPELVQIEA